MLLPTLYSKTNTGAIQFWQVSVEQDQGFGIVCTVYGQEGTDSPQTTIDIINKGKNIGKINETTVLR